MEEAKDKPHLVWNLPVYCEHNAIDLLLRFWMCALSLPYLTPRLVAFDQARWCTGVKGLECSLALRILSPILPVGRRLLARCVGSWGLSNSYGGVLA